jgi:tRNA threonylcarbamoyladenosine biosynthesis protein TsaE
VLLGDLGAGKTVLAGGIATGLGVPATSPVVSPTFTFARGYRGRVPMFHLDAYLVRSSGDLEASGWEELGGEGRVTVVEWGDRIADALPKDRLEVTLTADPTVARGPTGLGTAGRDGAQGDGPHGDAPKGDGPQGDRAAAPSSNEAPEPPSGRRVELVAGGPEAARVIARLKAMPAAEVTL